MRSRLVLLGGQTIVLGLTMAFLVVPASALFLDEYGAQALPYVYLAVAASGVAVSSAMSRAQRRHSLARVAVSVVGSYLVAIAAGWLVLVGLDGLWVTFPLLVLFPLVDPDRLRAGGHAGRPAARRSPDEGALPADSRRLLGRIRTRRPRRRRAGLPVRRAAQPPRCRRAGRRPHARPRRRDLAAFPGRAARPPGARPTSPSRSWTPAVGAAGGARSWPTGWCALILTYQLLSAAVTLLLDYMVWERAAARFPDPIALAQFQGLFGAVMNFVSVLVRGDAREAGR